MKTVNQMSQAQAKREVYEYANFQNLILRLTKKNYIVSFDSHDGLLQISVQPSSTGMGASVTIKENANWHDALKTLTLRLL